MSADRARGVDGDRETAAAKYVCGRCQLRHSSTPYACPACGRGQRQYMASGSDMQGIMPMYREYAASSSGLRVAAFRARVAAGAAAAGERRRERARERASLAPETAPGLGGFWDHGHTKGALGCAVGGSVLAPLLVWITGEFSVGAGILYGMGIGGAASLLLARSTWGRYSY